MPRTTNIVARNFYLNEQHELSRGEREGGRTPQYANVDWGSRGSSISQSLRSLKTVLGSSSDPIKDDHYFVVAKPVPQVTKKSSAKDAKDGVLSEKVDFAKNHSRVFGRLGMDLLRVTDDGSAIVHMKPEALDQFAKTTNVLGELGSREQGRWAAINNFSEIPVEARIDSAWIQSLTDENSTDAVIEFQPFLNRSDNDRLLRSISEKLQGKNEGITSTGSDFSGRQWVRGNLSRKSLNSIASTYFSVQSLHSPLISTVSSATSSQTTAPKAQIAPTVAIPSLPIIAIVDTGIVSNHAILSPYRRGTYVSPTAIPNNPNTHGSLVASRAVFGDVNLDAGPPVGSARFYDVNISGINFGKIDGKSVYPALQAVVSTAPDVRVFNLSFDTPPLASIDQVKRSAALDLIQDLDNFIFQNDILVIISSGNSEKGNIPLQSYPQHMDEPEWQLGAWASSFNSLTCGSAVQKLSANGVVKQLGWPSAFARVGPGINESPKPDFVANGGNCTDAYGPAPGLGVFGLNPSAVWEEIIGTSFAAPLLAREAAYALDLLNQVCEQGSSPFGVTIKAFLALTAEATASTQSLLPIRSKVARSLGMGYASANRLVAPNNDSAVLIWQGVLQDDKDIARVQIPIPSEWLATAVNPCLRIAVSYDPPVHSALIERWATRKVHCQLRSHAEGDAVRARNIGTGASYPLFRRTYKLPKDQVVVDDIWLMELAYEQTGEYYPSMVFPSQQRVAFAAELVDMSEDPDSPQAAIQAMPITATMTRLTLPPTTIRTPIFLKTGN